MNRSSLHHRGFSLIELMFSMAIGSVILILAATMLGSSGDDNISGDDDNDTLLGEAGDDSVTERILVVAHNHPDLHPGGTEIFAHDLFRAFGRFVNSLNGRYITAEDVGIDVQDMEYVLKETEYVTGVHQVHGGSGYSEELPIERIFRDTRGGMIPEGTTEIQTLIIGREVLGRCRGGYLLSKPATALRRVRCSPRSPRMKTCPKHCAAVRATPTISRVIGSAFGSDAGRKSTRSPRATSAT